MIKDVDELKPNDFNHKIYGDEKLPDDFILSIKEKGILEAIVIKSDGTIISGHRRWKAAKQLNIESVPVVIIEFSTELEEREAIINFNKQREKTISQKVAEADELKKIVSEKKNLNKISGVKIDLSQKSAEGSYQKTSDIVAKKTGLGSRDTYDKASSIVKKAKEGDFVAKTELGKLDRGETTVNAAYTTIKRNEPDFRQKELDKINNEFFHRLSSNITNAFDNLEKVIQGEYTPKSKMDFASLDAIRHNLYRIIRLAGEVGINVPAVWENYKCEVKNPERLQLPKEFKIEDVEIIK
jgi:hypothetical protein